LCAAPRDPRFDGDDGLEPPQAPMEELLRTNDAVLISFVEALLRGEGIEPWVADQNMSVVEGSLGVLPRRVMVAADKIEAARRLLVDAGMGGELSKAPR
jgi:hypothetical protein